MTCTKQGAWKISESINQHTCLPLTKSHLCNLGTLYPLVDLGLHLALVPLALLLCSTDLPKFQSTGYGFLNPTEWPATRLVYYQPIHHINSISSKEHIWSTFSQMWLPRLPSWRKLLQPVWNVNWFILLTVSTVIWWEETIIVASLFTVLVPPGVSNVKL